MQPYRMEESQVAIIGARLAALRESKKLSQREFAEALGLNRTTICCWESGSRKMDLVALAAIAKVLGMRLETVAKKLLEDINYASHRSSKKDSQRTRRA